MQMEADILNLRENVCKCLGKDTYSKLLLIQLLIFIFEVCHHREKMEASCCSGGNRQRKGSISTEEQVKDPK
jgi:hypothetical protein